MRKTAFCVALICFLTAFFPACNNAGGNSGDNITPIQKSEHTMELVDENGNRTTNFFGIHTMIYPMDDMDLHMDFAENLVGKGGFVKERFEPITPRTQGPASEWVEFLEQCYERELIPVVRIGGELGQNGGSRPEADEDGGYKGLAEAVKRVFKQLPMKQGVPIYVEVFNEVNLKYEWGDTPQPAEYGKCLVEISKALRSLGDERIRIMNGALSPGGDYHHLKYLSDMFRLVPESLWAFDVFASHSYPFNQPPERNLHDNTAIYRDHAIDSYLQELNVIKKAGRENVKVMITETGYSLENNPAETFKEFPMITDENRADYIERAFRDYWAKWPELIAVIPFEMWAYQNRNWQRFDWIDLDTERDENGMPTKARLQYYRVAAMKKPPYVKEEALMKTKDKPGITPVEGNLFYKAEVKTSTSIENYGWKTKKLVNGFKTDSDLGWSSNGKVQEEWIEFSLKEPKEISKILLYSRSDGNNSGKYFPQEFVIQVMVDGTYKNVYSFKNRKDDKYVPKNGVHTAKFRRVKSDKFRIVIIKKADSEGNATYHAQLAEVEAFK